MLIFEQTLPDALSCIYAMQCTTHQAEHNCYATSTTFLATQHLPLQLLDDLHSWLNPAKQTMQQSCANSNA
jgi:hypothetical protein